MNDQCYSQRGTLLTTRTSPIGLPYSGQKQGLLEQRQPSFQHINTLEPCVKLLQELLQFLLRSEQAHKNKNSDLKKLVANNFAKHQQREIIFKNTLTRKRSIKQKKINNKRPKVTKEIQHKEYTANANENNDNASLSPCSQPSDDNETLNNNIYYNKEPHHNYILTADQLTTSRTRSYNTNPLSYLKLRGNQDNSKWTFQNQCNNDNLTGLDLNENIFHHKLPKSDFELENFSHYREKNNNPLSSPPRRIPRYKIGTSVFNQARSNADLKKHNRNLITDSCDLNKEISIPRVNSAPPCFTSAAHKRSSIQKHNQDIGSVKTAGRFQQRLPDIHNFALNSNANAATGSRLPSWLANNQLGSVWGQNLTSSETTQDTVLKSAVNKTNVTGLFELPNRCVTTTSSDSKSSVRRKTTRESVTLPQISTNNKINAYPVEKNNSDVVFTKEDASKQRQKRAFIRAGRSGKTQHFELPGNQSRVDKDIAASVRCFCRISPSKNSCDHCQSERSNLNTTSQRESKEETHKYLSRIVRQKVVRNQQESSVEHKLRNPSSQTQQQKPFSTSLKERVTLVSSSSRSKVHTSSNNHHHSEESTSSAHSDRHCCDAFCLLFGGSHTNQLSASFVFGKLLHAAQSASPKRTSTLGILTPERSDMGCFHSVSNKSRVGPCRTNICSEVQATIDQSPTVIEEYSPIVLRYRTPYFRASAQVIMPPIRRRETWTVGWIQACDYMKFINQYGNLGCSSWEIPALKSGRIPAVSDSDGVSYPWYGNTTEIATIVGPTDNYRRMNLTMNDNFYPSVTWDIPVSEGTNAHLTRIVRDQSFITWLAAINETTKDIIVLKTVRWNFYLEIDIDPTRELGQRARIVAPRVQKQPLVTNGPCEKSRFNSSPVRSKRRGIAEENNSNSTYVGQIPISALVKPSANNAQTLIWRPSRSQPIIVVPAKEEHKDTNELVLFAGSTVMHGKESIVKEITKQEMIQLQQLAR